MLEQLVLFAQLRKQDKHVCFKHISPQIVYALTEWFGVRVSNGHLDSFTSQLPLRQQIKSSLSMQFLWLVISLKRVILFAEKSTFRFYKIPEWTWRKDETLFSISTHYQAWGCVFLNFFLSKIFRTFRLLSSSYVELEYLCHLIQLLGIAKI